MRECCWQIITTEKWKIRQTTGTRKSPGERLQLSRLRLDRSDPPTNDLGPPPDDLSPAAVAVWMDLIDEMPWLCGGDKWIVGLAARLSALTQAPDCPIGIYAQLRLCLASMGGTPADRSKVQWDDEESYDPMDEFIN